MVDADNQAILALIKQHEGFQSKVYKDSRGFLTIGYGRNLDNVGLKGSEWAKLIVNITLEQADYLLQNDINDTIKWLSSYSWWSNISANRKLALIDMGFNLGENKFKQFKQLILSLSSNNYQEAADQMKNSSWYTEVTNRAKQDINLMLNG